MNALLIVCVYKTGGDFDGEYVETIHEKLKHHNFVCLTDADDVPKHIPQKPLQHGWKTWWSKMEMFDPFLTTADILYFDLDTVIVGDNIERMYDACDHHNMIMLSDFYFPENLASGIMFIPNEQKELFWDEYVDDSDWVINNFRGDQDFLAYVIKKHDIAVDRWNEILPDYIASYKTHVIKSYPQHIKPLEVDVTKSNIICYHGKPRPKDTNWASNK